MARDRAVILHPDLQGTVAAERERILVPGELPAEAPGGLRAPDRAERGLSVQAPEALARRVVELARSDRAVSEHHRLGERPQAPEVLPGHRRRIHLRVGEAFDLPALKDLLARVRSRAVSVDSVETRSASPFARSLVFAYVAAYIYEQDAPLAERRAQALTLDRELLAELIGQEELRDLIDPEVLASVEQDLQRLSEGRRARDPDELHDLLRRLGDLSASEAAARTVASPEHWLAWLEHERRAGRVRVAGDPANPYGAALPWPRAGERHDRSPGRASGAFVVLHDGDLALVLERGGRSLLTYPPFDDDAVAAACIEALRSLQVDGRVRRLQIERLDGLAVGATPQRERLVALGFRPGYRGLVL